MQTIMDTMKVLFLNGAKGMVFLSMGAQTDTIKLAMAGIQDW